MFEKLRRQVLRANLELPKQSLVKLTWGNVSEIDWVNQAVAIKPSGVDFTEMNWEDIVVVSLEGNLLAGELNPSSDLKTHLELYKAFPKIGGVVHTHSRWATSFAQAGLDLECFGTTQADYFYGSVPCSRLLTEREIKENYEKNTGLVIIETFETKSIDYNQVPACLVHSHGPFIWGSNSVDAVNNAIVLEEIAFMNTITNILTNMDAEKNIIQKELLNKHYFRKHGTGAYYGQNRQNKI